MSAEPIVIAENRANLSDAEAGEWLNVLATHSSMRQALDWMLSRRPPLIPSAMIAQDEFSFDLPVATASATGKPLWLVYSTS